MTKDEITALFDQVAAGYDKQWDKLSAINECLYLLLGSIFAEVKADARVLCVGVGTGKEMIALAAKFPSWKFTAVEPSVQMTEVCRQNVETAGLTERCEFHLGYVDSLSNEVSFDVATSFLVSQFILDENSRKDFFQEIVIRLKPNGILVNTDLSFDRNSELYDSILDMWFRTMSNAEMDAEALEKMKGTYAKDVGILPPTTVSSIIQSAGLSKPVNFFQAGMIHGWFANKR